MNTVDRIFNKVVIKSAVSDNNSNILRVHNLVTGGFEDYVLVTPSSNNCCSDCCFRADAPGFRCCKTAPYMCTIFTDRSFKKLSDIMEEL